MQITEVMRKTWAHFIKAGLTKEGAAGLMGNLYSESGIIPNRVEMLCLQRLREAGKYYTDATYTAFVDDGTIGRYEFLYPLPGKQYGYGLAQWTSPSRKGKLYDHCKARKVSIGDLDAQLDFLVAELQQSYPSVWQVLTTTDSITEASDAVLIKFEMPADTGYAVRSVRADYATEIYISFAKEVSIMAKVTAQDVIKIMQMWVGYSEANGKHKYIVDVYNNFCAKRGKYPRGYKVPYNVAWCDVTISAAFILAGAVDLIGDVECGVEEHIAIFKSKGIWIEDGKITPKPGYIITYNWDQWVQPNDGYADHIGIVEDVRDGKIIVIEGNYNNSVNRRSIPIGWGYIRGFAAPKYAETQSTKATAQSTAKSTKATAQSTTQSTKVSTYTFTPSTVSNGSSGKSALLLQTLLRGLGYLGADNRPLDLDGQAGSNTISALRRYQGDHGLDQDGVAGPVTWKSIVGL